ncbi:MAG: ornithine carbamoyltransferase [Acidimicrobiales bacterium]
MTAMRHLLDIESLTPTDLVEILDLAEVRDPPQVLAGKGAALVFEKPSNRTRNSTEMAVVALGGHPVTMRGDEVGFGVRESSEDVARALAQYHAVLGARVYDHRVLERMVALNVVPVLNLLSERAHPLQALADLLTLRRHWGVLAGHRLAWVGDANNVALSLLAGCALAGVDVSLACPDGYGPPDEAVEAARARGIDVHLGVDPREGVKGAEVVCTDTWVSMGQEEEAAQRREAFAGFSVDAALMEAAAPGAVFLHCLPAHRGEEVTAEVIDGPASLVWPEAANRMHAARGALLWLLW